MVAASHERAGIFCAPVARAACPARSSTGQSHALHSSRLAFPVSLFLGYHLSRFGFIYECLRSQRAFDIDRRLMSHSYRPPRPHSKSSWREFPSSPIVSLYYVPSISIIQRIIFPIKYYLINKECN